MNSLIKPGGNILIVFNHYNDRFGSHLTEYISSPWPQSLFEEELLFEYWNKKFSEDTNITDNSYFPRSHKYGTKQQNTDCFMGLNKLSISEFEQTIERSNVRYIKKIDYSKSVLIKLVSFLPKKYLLGSCIYHFKKVGTV